VIAADATSGYLYIKLSRRIGRRIQLTLTDEQLEALERESATSGLSIAAIVRRALDYTFELNLREQVLGYELSVAVWRRPDAAAVKRRLIPKRRRRP
jgi:hypothetical protein